MPDRMKELSVNLLGGLSVYWGGERVPLPASRKTRALLGYLILSEAPQRRDRLCELFWDIPDDPRGALRWSLSKLRTVLNFGGVSRLLADRERVRILTEGVGVDVRRVRACADDPEVSIVQKEAAWRASGSLLLDDCELANQPGFGAWLERERQEVVRLRAFLARSLALNPQLSPDMAVLWADRWLDDRPLDPAAARAAIFLRRRAGRAEEAARRVVELEAAFREADLALPDWVAIEPLAEATPGMPSLPVAAGDGKWLEANHRPGQTVRFARAEDGACLAWASVGSEIAPPLVKAANWLTHLELDWQSPVWSPLFRELATRHRLIRYDERGCGLSDWNVGQISLETFVSDLEIVVDAAGLERFPLLGISQGASVSIEYAARHPERVSHLVLFGGYPAGWRHLATAAEVREREAIMVLTEAGWGRADPSYRRLFSATFMPDARQDELEWFDEFQRRTTSAENAVRFLQAFAEIDVRHRLAGLKVPTLVIHSRGDQRIPLATGRELAAAIPGAQFVGLESNNHLLIGREPASAAFVAAVREFLVPKNH